MSGPGKRAAERPKRSVSRRTKLATVATAAAFTAWVGLVWTAIQFGADARNGDGSAWAFVALITVAAIALLFAALMGLAHTLSQFATPAKPARTGEPEDPHLPSDPPTAPGGRRAAR